MTALEFWIGTATDANGDMQWSDIIWCDGLHAAGALETARSYADADDAPSGCTIAVHGPYVTNRAAEGVI
ncbi:hypothetical protein [Caenibius sp. WL]|uniref:hypothetical protein n=1 Tax=Caenibius sp. WL TaxID=2872646 RepID=UPI001C98EAF8|nr:hypothetical protein [Caenibius sp. WL]QZP06767.1 hypothetical protein K5X80_08505 [Caenibius sp. WL]